ncbi:type II secretion system protein [bacterium]|nr:type II secretion system protein [bacterium]
MLKGRHRASFWGTFLADLLDKQKSGFTLAETLIALAIIGIVAAMTLPALMTKINDTVKGHQMSVFTRKFAKGTDLLNIENGIGPYYGSTREFVEALSKHLKIVTICDSGDDMKNCLHYDKIQTNGEDVKVSLITKGKDFGLNESDYPDVAGIVLADGTPMILSWNVNCPVSDPDVVSNEKVAESYTYSCVKGFVDLNGNKGPNKLSTTEKIHDITGFNGTSVLKDECVMKITSGNNKGKCLITPPNEYKKMSYNECKQVRTQYNIPVCMWMEGGYYSETPSDAYAGVVRACGGPSKLPSREDLYNLATLLYRRTVPQGDGYKVVLNVSIADTSRALLGISNVGNGYFILSGELNPANDREVYVRSYSNGTTNSGYYGRSTNPGVVLCVSD